MSNLVPYRPGRASIFDTIGALDHVFAPFFAAPAPRTRAPAVDIREEDDGYLVQVDLPGVAEKDLKVSVDDDVLTVSAKAGTDADRKPDGYLVRERRRAAYTRSFVLPRDTDYQGVTATFADGVLTLNVPKDEASKARQIPVNAAA